MLVVVDPLARSADGESVRIARDVLRAGAQSLKICFPESAAEWERMLAHRGRRRPVVVGGDAALLRTVRFLHREGGLAQAALSFVPVGPGAAGGLAGRLGVPVSAVAAARAALDGVERVRDLLVDDAGGIVVGEVRIPGGGVPEPGGARVPAQASGGGERESDDPVRRRWLERGARSLVRTLTHPLPGLAGHGHRLHVEADGVVLADPDRPVHEVCAHAPAGGRTEVAVRHQDGSGNTVYAGELTVSGREFRYRADEGPTGPVRSRTWRVEPAAWLLTVPREPEAGATGGHG